MGILMNLHWDIYIYIYLYLFTVYVYDTGIMLGLQREYNGN